ncbi:LysR family transcriptional regulator [Nocardia sp. Root136]|uniref:LysR family transcriptional regulator n=1 Tax=Nocardia sp. Root136 TaxID=1736458 RepID=UPI0007C690E5|nr:LysR family transcriptional regulator [Nocardia sp. Root136]
MIDTHRLMIFRSVVATGSVAAAAATLGYSPSAISQHLTALQRETGLRLLERVGRGVEPTPAGRVIAGEAAKVLDELTALGSTVSDLRAGKAARITINSFSSSGTNWMPDVVATLTHEFPDTRVRLRIVDELAAIADNRPDIALTVRLDKPTQVSGYSHRDLITEPYVVVVPGDHELAARTTVDVAELEQYRWIDNDTSHGPCRQAMLNACAAAGFTPRFVVETTDYPSALRFVARGVGLTVVPRLGATDLPSGACALELTNPTPRRTICAHIKDSESYNPVVLRTMELLDELAVRPRGRLVTPSAEGAQSSSRTTR